MDHHAQLARLWDLYQPPQAAWPGDQGPLRALELMQRARVPMAFRLRAWLTCHLKFWTLFAERLAHWSERDVFPAAWREARMVLLPKDDLAGAVADVSRLRPITVFNAAYRVVVGAWTSRPRVQGWLPDVCPSCFHGGITGRNAWQALRHLEAAWGNFRLREVLRQSLTETRPWQLGAAWLPC